jgi:hypothetical protein
MSIFQTTRWSVWVAMSKARRLRGPIAPTFGTIAGGRNNPADTRSKQAKMKKPRLVSRPLLFQSKSAKYLPSCHGLTMRPCRAALFCPNPGRFDDWPPFFHLSLLLHCESIRRLFVGRPGLLPELNEPLMQGRIG